jgi:hypothetical protein
MRSGVSFIASMAVFIASQSGAAQNEVQYGAVPGWTIPVPIGGDSPEPENAPVRFGYFDYQIHLGPNGDEIFSAYRLKILRPEALNAGNITVSWLPDAGDATVHYLRIIRDNQVIDVLKESRFQVLQREGFLEQAALNGQLTAALQVPGLRVNDELEFATISLVFTVVADQQWQLFGCS